MPWRVTAADFHDIASGKRRDWKAAGCRTLMGLAELPYGAAMRWRNYRFDRGRRETYRAPCPVVSVGNITLGGVGKTPMVEWLAKWLRLRQVRVAILSRGYGAQAGAQNDEALELEERLPDVPHLQDPDRALSAHIAVEELASQFLLLDDGFQHRRMERDLDIVLLDALSPFGYGRIFPRGALREPLAGLARAQFIGLSRADAVSPERRAEIREQAAKLAPTATWLELRHQPIELVRWRGEPAPIESLTGKTVAAFCGIGNPEGFRHTLAACGCETSDLRIFPDHHAYSAADIESLENWSDRLPLATQSILCTCKDLVKIQMGSLAGRPLFAVKVGIEITMGREPFVAGFEPLVQKALEL
jgi:tetraacyldisaccharide 4'-kinase